MIVFKDRQEAGRKLAEALARRLATATGAIVLGLPRGGVPVAFEIAQRLDAPLDVMLVRKLGTPRQPELAMGAIAEGGIRYLNDEVVSGLAVPRAQIEAAMVREQKELARRALAYRGDWPAPELRGRTVILVDDGLATGATMHAAVNAARQAGATRVTVAVPTAAADSLAGLNRECDETVCLATPDPYFAVGVWYQNFEQVSDEQVRVLLERARRRFRAQTQRRAIP